MNKIHSWCMDHKKSMILIGLAIIFIGLLIDYQWNPSHDTLISAVSHLFIIFGEAIIVMFLLHLIIEEKHHHQNREESRLIVEDLKEKSLALITEQAEAFKGLTDQIKGDLFEAILKDKMPHDMVKQMLDSNFFKPTYLRRNLKVKYTYDKIEGNILYIIQTIEFDIEYAVGNEPSIYYEMPFSLSDSPLAKYQLKEAGYREYGGNQLKPEIHKFYDREEDFIKKEFGPNQDKDYFSLVKKVSLNKKEKIHVHQIIEAKFTLQKSGIVDNYFVNHHTLKADIEIEFPENYEFNIYPTFPEQDLPTPTVTGRKKAYENIKFLIPGQGWGYSILKKD